MIFNGCLTFFEWMFIPWLNIPQCGTQRLLLSKMSVCDSFCTDRYEYIYLGIKIKICSYHEDNTQKKLVFLKISKNELHSQLPNLDNHCNTLPIFLTSTYMCSLYVNIEVTYIHFFKKSYYYITFFFHLKLYHVQLSMPVIPVENIMTKWYSTV